MKRKITKKIILLNAVIWAAAMLIGSYFLKASEDIWSIMFIFLIGGFTIVNTYLDKERRKQSGVKSRC